MTVYVLYFSYPYEGGAVLGIYTTKEAAEAAEKADCDQEVTWIEKVEIDTEFYINI